MTSITSVTHSEQNSLVTSAGVTAYLQHASDVKFVINATGVAPLEYQIQGPGFNSLASNNNTYTAKMITNGTVPIVVDVWDKNGAHAQTTVNLTVAAYNKPEAKLVANRTDSSGVISPTGTYIKSVSTGSVKSLYYSGSEKNQLRYNLQARESGSSSWVTLKGTTTMSGTTLNVTDIINGSLNPVKSYDVFLYVLDRFFATGYSFKLSTEDTVMSWSRTGVGVGKTWERGGLDVNGDVYINGNTLYGVSAIPSTTDLNTMMTVGTYVARGTPSAGLNYPLPLNWGVLEVMRDAYSLASNDAIIQRYTNSALGITYFRNYIGGAWTTWKDVDTVAIAGSVYVNGGTNDSLSTSNVAVPRMSTVRHLSGGVTVPSNPGGLTVPKAGWYNIAGSICVTWEDSWAAVTCEICQNGATLSRIRFARGDAANTYDIHHTTINYPLLAGDTIRLYVSQESHSSGTFSKLGNNLIFVANTLSLARIGYAS